MSVKVVFNNLPKFLANIKKIETKAVFVGIPHDNDKRKEDGETNAEIAFTQEFGSPARHIPPRPFLMPGIEKAHDKIKDALKEGLREIVKDGADTDKCLQKAGLIGQASVQNEIRTGSFEALKESTIKSRQAARKSGKAGTKPLIDTGQLLSSITYAVK